MKHLSFEELGSPPGKVWVTRRNVYDLVVSWWLLNPQLKWSLERFIKEYNHSHFVREGRLFWLWVDGAEWLHYETMESQLGITLPRLNVTPGKDRRFMDYYDDSSIEAIHSRFKEEV